MTYTSFGNRFYASVLTGDHNIALL